MNERRALLLWWISLFAVLVGVAFTRSYLGNDGYQHIAFGARLLDEGGLPGRDPFSFASIAREHISHNLLALYAFAWLERTWGLESIVFAATVSGVLVALAFLLQGTASWRARLFATPLLFLCFVIDREMFEARTQNFAHLLFVALLALVWRLKQGARVHPVVPVALASFWAMWHPSFPVLVAVPVGTAVLLYALEPPEHRPALAPFFHFAGLAALGTLASPYGLRLVVDALDMFKDPTTQHIFHMRSPPFSSPLWLVWLVLSIAVVALRTAHGPERHRWTEALLCLLLVFATCVSRRYVVLSVAMTLRVALPSLDALLAARHGLVRAGPWLLTGVAAAQLSIGAWLLSRPKAPWDRHLAPAVSFIDEHELPDRVLTRYGQGGYLMYRWQGLRRFFIHGLNNLFVNGVFDDYLRMSEAMPDTESLLDLYEINTVLWVVDTPLDAFLAAHDDWLEVFRNEGSVIYVRRGTGARE